MSKKENIHRMKCKYWEGKECNCDHVDDRVEGEGSHPLTGADYLRYRDNTIKFGGACNGSGNGTGYAA